jgi:putative ATP-dependent endonuclease of OLD family
VVVLRPTEKVIEPAEGARSTVQITTPLVLDRVPLSPEDRIKIDQYLDVTRSELLFTRRAILVEGISEAVLLPILAKHCVFSKQDDRDKLRWKRFCATSIINLGMVDFEPYVKLLLHPQNGVSLIDKLVIVTDGDPDITEDGDKSAECLEDDSISIASDIQPASVSTDSRATPTKGAGEKRAEELTKIAKDLGVEKSLFIAQSRYTLEADLLDPFTTNGPLIKEVFLKHKPNSGKFWQSVEESADHALTFYKKLVGTRRFVRKGEYAHQISSLIREGAPFECPKYLRAAITSVVEDGK